MKSAYLLIILMAGLTGCYLKGEKDCNLRKEASAGNVAGVKKWIERGARVNTRTIYDGNHYQDTDHADTPLLVAIRNMHLEVASILIEFGADVNIKDSGETTALRIAVKLGNVMIIKLLVDKGANIEEKGLLRIAIENKNQEVSKYLLEKGCNIIEQSLLILACENNLEEIALMLIDRNVDVREDRLLHLASANGMIKVVEILLKKNIYVDGLYKSRTALHMACEKNHIEIVKKLIASGADINAKDSHKSSPFSIACTRGHADLLRILIEKGAKDNRRGLIHEACWNGFAEVVKILVENGVDSREENEDGKTPLQVAIENSRTEVVRYLKSIEVSGEDK